jgi:putative toxin-antitoxin system antitoxin component (TIGR02293 family)
MAKEACRRPGLPPPPSGQAEAGPLIRPMADLSVAREPNAIMAGVYQIAAVRRSPTWQSRKPFGVHAGRVLPFVPYCTKFMANGMKRRTLMPRAKSTGRAGMSESPSSPYSAAPEHQVYAALEDLAQAAEVSVPIARATPGALAGLSRRGYSEEEIWRLVIPRRTLARRHSANEPLTVEETDKALRLERIASLAERVFGDPAKAYRWMRKPKRGLNEATPVDFLASEAGARKIEEWLHRIDHGMAA